jgi:hypothetical protein
VGFTVSSAEQRNLTLGLTRRLWPSYLGILLIGGRVQSLVIRQMFHGEAVIK